MLKGVIKVLKILLAISLWSFSAIVFLFLATLFHELAHYYVAKAVGFQIAGYSLLTIPFMRRGYVDVRIRGTFANLYLRKAAMHGAGLAVHLVAAGFCLWGILSGWPWLWQGIFLTGLIINSYLLILNCLPNDSDGRRMVTALRNWVITDGKK